MIAIYALVAIWVAIAIAIIAHGVCHIWRENRAWHIRITDTKPPTATLSYFDARERIHKSIVVPVAVSPASATKVTDAMTAPGGK